MKSKKHLLVALIVAVLTHPLHYLGLGNW
jgi:hypothetical protein